MTVLIETKYKKFIGKIEMINKNPQIYKEILKYNEKYFNEVKWGQKYYNYLNNISKPPKCKCGKSLKFYKFSKGYSKYCSNKCRYNDEDLKLKIKKAYLKKYGVDNPLKSKEIQETRKENCLKKYGVEHHSKLKETINKKKETNLKRYGLASNLHHTTTLEKTKKTNIKKYGVEHHSKSKEIKEKKRKTNIKKYGVGCNLQLPEIKKNNKLNSEKKILKKYANLIGISEDNLEIIGENIRIYNYCNKHPFFDISKSNLYCRVVYYNNKERLCTECYNIRTPSNIEIELKNFLLELDNNFVLNNRNIISPYELDIFNSKHKIGIELNGLYWHSTQFKDNKYHLNKTNLCIDKNIQLLQIFEDEWINKKEIVKSIIKSKLGFFGEKIYARKCEVKEINDNKLVRFFLNENHIQGFIGAKHKIGLFYNNELVSLMSFGKSRKSLGSNFKNNEYEMLRFCNKLNTQVIGGASKLLNYFIKNNKPNKITTFADRRYSNGNLYEKLNFEKKYNTKPNYWYFKRNTMQRYHRFNFRKDKLVKEGYNKNKTEFQIMEERGYFRIYDCGNIKYELTL